LKPAPNWIILAGGYGLPDRTASAVRVLGQAALFRSLGFQVLVLGKLRDRMVGEDVTYNGILCRDVRAPVDGCRCKSYVSSAQPVALTIDSLGAERVKAVIAYNYPARGAWQLIRLCRAKKIAPVLDITEWYGWEGRKVLRNIWRLAGVEFRLRILTRWVGNVIVASRWFGERVSRQHRLLMPFVVDVSRPQWQRGSVPDCSRPANLVYAGSPGSGMYKDRVPIMVDALARLSAEGHDFRLSVAGITAEQYLKVVPNHRNVVDLLDAKLCFLGRIPHENSLELLRNADFSVFFRKPGRVADTGFPTKYVEAATLGVPVISNPTSDIALYLRDGENGFMARSIAADDVAAALRRAVTQKPAARAAMTATCRSENPFDLRAWQDDARVFLENLRGLA